MLDNRIIQLITDPLADDVKLGVGVLKFEDGDWLPVFTIEPPEDELDYYVGIFQFLLQGQLAVDPSIKEKVKALNWVFGDDLHNDIIVEIEKFKTRFTLSIKSKAKNRDIKIIRDALNVLGMQEYLDHAVICSVAELAYDQINGPALQQFLDLFSKVHVYMVTLKKKNGIDKRLQVFKHHLLVYEKI